MVENMESVKRYWIDQEDYIVINNRVCEVVGIGASGGKLTFKAIDIFTGEKHEDTAPAQSDVVIPEAEECDYLLMDIADDDTLMLMPVDIDENDEEREDLKLPKREDLRARIRELYHKMETGGPTVAVTVVKAMGEEAVAGVFELLTAEEREERGLPVE